MGKTYRPNTERATQRIYILVLENLSESEEFPWADGCCGDLVSLDASDWNFLISGTGFLPTLKEVVSLIVENPQWLSVCKISKFSESDAYLLLAHFIFWKLVPQIHVRLEAHARRKYKIREGREYDPEMGL